MTERVADKPYMRRERSRGTTKEFAGTDCMNKRRSIALLLACSFLLPSSAQAATDNEPLYAAAAYYRDAVINFERVVLGVRGIQRTDERVVDQFEVATKKMLLAARNPRHLSRLRNELKRVLPLQNRVESLIFGKYTPNHDLVRAWQKVLYGRAMFDDELFFQIENANHGDSVRRRTYSTQWNRFPQSTSGDANR